jgi:hypothetical protein
VHQRDKRRVGAHPIGVTAAHPSQRHDPIMGMRETRASSRRWAQRWRGTLALLVVVMGLLVLPGAVGAAPTTIHVSTTGADSAACGASEATACQTIAKAVALTADGDTVRVGPGRFGVEEPPSGGGIAVKKQITLLGAQAGIDPRDPANPTARTPGGPGETVVFDSNPATKAGALIVATTVPNVTVDGFTFTASALGSGLQIGNKNRLGGYRVANNIFWRNGAGMYPDPSGPEQSTIEHNLFAENGTPGKTVAGNGNGLYSSEARNVVIRENLFRDNGQTLAIDTRTTAQGGLVGGADVSFTDNISTGGDGPVFTSVRGLTIADNTIEAGTGTRGLYLGGNEQDDVHVLRNTINGFSNIGIYLKQSNPGTPQNGDVEIRQNTIANGGTGILLTSEASQRRLEIEHNRIVDNADGGLTNNDPDVVIDARHNWWGCNAGPNLDPGCGSVTSPSGGSLVPYAPWMVLTLTATPMPQYAGDRSTLLASVNSLVDGTTPAGPFFLTGQALFGSTPAGTHNPPTVPLVHANVSAQSAYTAGPEDPDELHTTVDNQTVRIKLFRPARPDVVPTVTPDDPTLTPGQKLTLLVGLVNQGNKVAAPVTACLRLSEKFDAITGLCRTIARLRPGHPIVRRIAVRLRRRACPGELTHRVIVRAPGLRARVQRAIGRVIADPCTNPPCGSAASDRRDADVGARHAADALIDRGHGRPRAHTAC